MVMRLEFTADENGYTEDGFRILNPISKKSMYIKNAIYIAFLLIMYVVLWVFLPSVERFYFYILLVLIIGAIIYFIVSPIIYYNHYCYKISDDKIEIRKGIFVLNQELVPIERIHQVNVSRGPINRFFDLASVTITTAGGNATLEYLDKDLASEIANKLNEIVIEILKKRE